MKKLLIVAIIGFLSFNSAYGRDYAKLQIKEMKHAQKYGTTNKYYENAAHVKNVNNENLPTLANKNLKDPKILKLNNYEIIDEDKYKVKLEEDNKIYAKIAKSFGVRNVDNYNAQAKGEDYYRIYRVAERIIRANNLDYINWRIAVYRDAESPNAYSTNMNYIAISTSIFDTFANNDDALAMLIGHELAHALLGHQQRRLNTLAKMDKCYQLSKAGDSTATLTYSVLRRKFLIDSKNMEYAADVEGAKLAAKAGYSLDNASELLSFLNTLPAIGDFYSDHPDASKRIQNFNENRKYFVEEEWANVGKYNIYNSEVLDVNLSSDRKSIVISAPLEKLEPQKYYRPEKMDEIYVRLGYKSYLNGEYIKSLKYFEDLFEINQKNASAYLYASYVAESLYQLKNSKKLLEKAKNYAQKALELEPDNEYMKQQVEDLKKYKISK